MKKEITLYELLTLIQNHESPKEVMYKGNKYKICGNDYYSDSLGFHYLSAEIAKSGSMLDMLKNSNITYDAPVLTDKEKAYLTAVLNPFKEKEMKIIKCASFIDGKWCHEYITIDFGNEGDTVFPSFKGSSMYAGMELGREYTPVELGLFEED